MPLTDYSKHENSRNPEVTDVALNHIARHSCQILEHGGPAGHTPRGSGVLVTILDRFYLLTASHVADTKEHEPLYITTKNGVREIVGRVRISDLEIDNKLDLAYYQLDENFAELLEESYVFLPEQGIQVSHVINEENIYMTYGYPAKNIKFDKETRTVRVGAEFHSMRPSKQKVYDYYGFEKELACIFDYSGKGTSYFTEEVVKVNPEPYGMSGCGLWVLYQTSDEKVPIVYGLAGIMTELRKGKYHVLIGNWVDAIIEKILEDNQNPPE